MAGFCLVPLFWCLAFPAGRFGLKEIMISGAIGALSAVGCWFVAERVQASCRKAVTENS
jgi:hypothetical protein